MCFRSQYAIQSGCNIIDTSTNYEDGASEVMVGNVISGMVSEGLIDRNNVVLMSKVGYIQGRNLDNVRSLVEEAEEEGGGEGKLYSGVVKVNEETHWHCIDPQFIADQLTESLQRLNMSTVDVLLLHNPEHMWTESDTSESFYAKISRAFEHLEREVEAGRIQRYGISSNTFPRDPNERGNVSLVKCLEIARGSMYNNPSICP